MEFAGNLIPVLQSGDQPRLDFKAFRENRLAFNMRLRDHVSNNCGDRIYIYIQGGKKVWNIANIF